MVHAFAYRRGNGLPISITSPSHPSFGHRPGDEKYRLIGDDDVAAHLREKERHGVAMFRYITHDRLEDALSSADSAIGAVEAGELDDVLDLLLFAERNEYGNRVTVINAIDKRQQTIVEQRHVENGGTENTVSVDDVASVVEHAE